MIPADPDGASPLARRSVNREEQSMSKSKRGIRFTVRRPISADPRLQREGMVVSRHRSLYRALLALDKQRARAARQGGYCRDYLWDMERSGRARRRASRES